MAELEGQDDRFITCGAVKSALWSALVALDDWAREEGGGSAPSQKELTHDVYVGRCAIRRLYNSDLGADEDHYIMETLDRDQAWALRFALDVGRYIATRNRAAIQHILRA